MCAITKHANPIIKVKKTRRRRVSPEERAARRRKQHRELVARGRAKARSSLAQAREEEASLRRKLHEMVESYSFVARVVSSLECDQILWRGSLESKVIDLIVERVRLEKANEQLEDQLDKYLAFQKLVVSEDKSTTEVSVDVSVPDFGNSDMLTARLHEQLGRSYWSVPSSSSDEFSFASLVRFGEDGDSCIV